MKAINRILEAKLITHDLREYEVDFPQKDNNFRFFPKLSQSVSTKTNGIVRLTVDKIVMPKELFKQDIINKHFTLKAKVLVGEQNVCLYELKTDISIPNDAYTAHNVNSVSDDHLIEIAPLQITIPAYKTIHFDEIAD